MTDIHTHILPCIDDGSGSVEESLALLSLERTQGVNAVVLTPHFYGARESLNDFLTRRQWAWDKLQPHLPENAPTLVLGAETAWFPSLGKLERLERLCMGDSGNILLELPFERWSTRLFDQIYDFSCATGLTPILAHVERYLSMQGKKRIQDLIDLGFPMQVNADSLLGLWGRHRCLTLLKRGTWYLGSDCHDLQTRPPRLGQALGQLKKLDPARIGRMTSWNAERGVEDL
ncbi:MAG: hypothetical protein Q4C72_03255 [Eubacteriales bacterium]|nr:hypothetical protein [Eubacteriales bacterium]